MNGKINKSTLDRSNEIAIGEPDDSDQQESMLGTLRPRTMTSEVLFAGARELLIKHANESYRLRITNQGKLILTK